MPRLSERLLDWFDRHGRRDLPWQHDATPYRVWVSEIMLQQTQVATVIPYFDRFVARFGSVSELAAADIDEVLHLWSGLGYYARGRNLHRAAAIVADECAGEFPRDLEALTALPGIGRSTAGAILALAHGERHPILDGNVKRVLARYHQIDGWPGEIRVQAVLWSHAEAHTPNSRVAEYTQAIMDLGATLCVRRKPRCGCCPLRTDCAVFANDAQDHYPVRRKRKPLPVKSTRFLIARTSDGATLLNRRPPLGIWGGLWSFPEIDAANDLESWCGALGLIQVGKVVERSVITHTFTHFRWAITPFEFVVDRKGLAIMDSDRWLWYNVAQPARIGLAKPVKQLLEAPARNLQEDTT
jgi:A/G-specific adenine glycosylase